MRYKVTLSYLGTNYAGWQRQPGSMTVQQKIEEAFGIILREPVELTGCGRTDAGVHAKDYVAHMDIQSAVEPEKFLYQVNAILPTDIAIQSVQKVHDEFHARFDAQWRSYKYTIHFEKNPFLQGQSFYLSRNSELDQQAMSKVADLFLKYSEYYPFSKTGSDNKGYTCKVSEAHWHFEKNGCWYFVKANRFLRGMVRLMAGASLNVGYGKMSVDTIEECMVQQTMLPLQWSVPAEGLRFEGVGY